MGAATTTDNSFATDDGLSPNESVTVSRSATTTLSLESNPLMVKTLVRRDTMNTETIEQIHNALLDYAKKKPKGTPTSSTLQSNKLVAKKNTVIAFPDELTQRRMKSKSKSSKTSGSSSERLPSRRYSDFH